MNDPKVKTHYIYIYIACSGNEPAARNSPGACHGSRSPGCPQGKSRCLTWMELVSLGRRVGRRKVPGSRP